MKEAIMIILPETKTRLTHQEIKERVKSHFPKNLFPGGAKTDWYSKTVQLDLETKRSPSE